MDDFDLTDTPLLASGDLYELLARFLFNSLVVWIIIHLLYYPKSKRRDYYFTFMLISVSIFFLIFLLGGLNLFVIIAISVINALAVTLSIAELIAVNALFILAILLCELNLLNKLHQEKLVVYDRIDLIVPEKHDELVKDLEKRLGLTVIEVEIGAVDFLRDTAMLKVHYTARGQNSVNHILKISKEKKQ